MVYSWPSKSNQNKQINFNLYIHEMDLQFINTFGYRLKSKNATKAQIPCISSFLF